MQAVGNRQLLEVQPETLNRIENGSGTPRRGLEIVNTHFSQLAIDLVPEGIDSASNPDWTRSVLPQEKMVFAVVNGLALRGQYHGDVKLRTDEGICYEYKHIEPFANDVAYGSLIGAGTPLGMIETHRQRDPDHLHIAIYPCDTSGFLSGSQIAPATLLSHIVSYQR